MISKEIFETFAGWEKLISWFGRWPSFHNWEVLSVSLDRTIDHGGPSFQLRLYGFQTVRETEADRTYKRIRQCIVTLVFDAVEDFEMSGFNHQNVIADLIVERSTKFRIQLVPTFGLDADFLADSVAVKDVSSYEGKTRQPE